MQVKGWPTIDISNAFIKVQSRLVGISALIKVFPYQIWRVAVPIPKTSHCGYLSKEKY